ncbi:MAG: hypothetical protein HY060_11135 [Proteobacteria bacterium]|nr:hypothetical protein [Pseudomonadota bacterium]
MTALRLPRIAGLLGLLAASVLLAACTQPAAVGPRFPEITFQQYRPFEFAVGRVEIVREYVPPLAAPNVDHLFAVPPLRMAEQWARDRLVATGGPGELRFVIKRASVVEAELPRTTGIRGAFTKDQSQRYDAVLEVEIEIRSERGYRDGIVSARAERRQSVAEDISLAERERTWFSLTEALARDLNAELDRNIPVALPRFLTQR